MLHDDAALFSLQDTISGRDGQFTPPAMSRHLVVLDDIVVLDASLPLRCAERMYVLITSEHGNWRRLLEDLREGPRPISLVVLLR